MVSFTASAAPPAWLITAALTRFTRSTVARLRDFPALLRLAAFFGPLLLFRAALFFAPRAVGRFVPLRFFAAPAFFAPRADGRRDDDFFFAPPRADEPRFAPERLLPFFADLRAELEPERFPRFDLALLAMSVTSSRVVSAASAIFEHKLVRASLTTECNMNCIRASGERHQ